MESVKNFNEYFGAQELLKKAQAEAAAAEREAQEDYPAPTEAELNLLKAIKKSNKEYEVPDDNHELSNLIKKNKSFLQEHELDYLITADFDTRLELYRYQDRIYTIVDGALDIPFCSFPEDVQELASKLYIQSKEQF